MKHFKDFQLQQEIQNAIKELGYEMPTPIQTKTIPILLKENKDIIATAQTGTGKTAAFGLPSITLTDLSNKVPQTLVLCPTRELCIQIAKDLMSYSKYIDKLNVVPVYGGAGMDSQIRALKKGAHIVIGTPGRTKDMIRRKKLKLQNVERVILDEADEMLTMGFKEDMEEILSSTPEQKQTLLFSATMSKKIISITQQYMKNPLKISVASENKGAENVDHIFYMVQARDRYEVLKRIADLNPNIYGITFCRTRRETKEIANKLIHDGYNADAIHGDLSQTQRDEVMGRFRKRQLQILVATDVAARGLDVNDLTHIINYNLPDETEVYTHRSGRTGRAGKSGISIAICHSREIYKIKDIERKTKIKFIKEMVPKGKEICQAQLMVLIDKVKNIEVDENQIEPFLSEIYYKLKSFDREDIIKHFVSIEFNRFLNYYKNSKDINLKSNLSKNDNRREKRSRSQRRKSKFVNLFINLGLKNNLNPNRLMGIINESLHSDNAIIGKIEIMKKFTFFELEENKKYQLIKNLSNQEFEGEKILIEVAKEKPKIKENNSYSDSKKKRGRGNKSKLKRNRSQSKNRDYNPRKKPK
ncbi:MAG: DEAD/DEAH box helicase [Candidatus Marinimicrobia bacterium]|nr:DEAD/DEAH box helicase [Candidatus Neomarinimicrobiota bacterium]